MIAALYVDSDRGPYPRMASIDCWDVQRDARLYNGPHPVVAHPPCNSWGRLRQMRLEKWDSRWGNKQALDHDAQGMQCGIIATTQVRRFGGVLEHPAGSLLWHYMNLPLPGAFPDQWGGLDPVCLSGCVRSSSRQAHVAVHRWCRARQYYCKALRAWKARQHRERSMESGSASYANPIC